MPRNLSDPVVIILVAIALLGTRPTVTTADDSRQCSFINAEGAIDRSATLFAMNLNATKDVVITSLGLHFLNPSVAHSFGNKSAVRPYAEPHSPAPFFKLPNFSRCDL